jgi:ElaB/YqjD/DUF883 family membrane-anchored ribosome-binding protein
MSATAVKAGRAYVELGVNSGKLIAGLNAASKRLSSFAGGVRRTGVVVAGIGTAALGGMAIAAKSFASAGARIRDLQLRTGLAAETLSRLDYAAAQTGTSLDATVTGVRTLAKQINQANRGVSSASRLFEELGIEFGSFSQLSLEDQFVVAGDALSRITDETQRAALAQELFGRSGLELVPIFERGADSFRAFAKEAQDLGLVIGEDEAKQAKALDDSFTRVTRTLQRAVATIGGALAPAIESLANRLAAALARVREFIASNQQIVTVAAKVAIGVAAAGSALIVLGGVLKGVAVSLIGIGLAIKGVLLLKAAFLALASPIVLIGAAVAGLVAAFFQFTEIGQQAVAAVGDSFAKLRNVGSDAWNGIADAIRANNLELAGEIAIVGLQLAFQRGTEDIQLIWNDWVYDLAGALTVIEEEAKRVLGSIGEFSGGVVRSLGTALREIPALNKLSTFLEVAGGAYRAIGTGLAAGTDSRTQERIGELGAARDAAADAIRSVGDDLSGRLRELREQAEREAEEARNRTPTSTIEPKSLDDLANIMQSGSQRADAISSRAFGTFSALAASRVSNEARWQSDLLSATRQIAKNTQAIGGTFTP